jgi:hypothetical protein
MSWLLPQGGLDMSRVDGLLGITQQTISVGASELICRLNMASSSFAKAADNLWQASRIRISASSVRTIVESEGQLAAAALSEANGRPPWVASECQSPQGPTRVYIGCDGVKVPTVKHDEKLKRREKAMRNRKSGGKPGKFKRLPPVNKGADDSYKEMRIVTFYDEDQKRRHVAVTSGNHRKTGRMMKKLSRWLGLGEADELGGLIDGATWIRARMEELKLPQLRLVLDFYHLSEHVHAAARAVFGEGQDTGRQWAGEVLHVAKHEGFEALWERLGSWRSGLRGKTKRKAADSLLHYVSERKAMMHYDWALAHGWQIGSGPTEAMCKTTTSRVKRSGMRWDLANAEKIMALEALEQSRQFDDYWNARRSNAA